MSDGNELHRFMDAYLTHERTSGNLRETKESEHVAMLRQALDDISQVIERHRTILGAARLHDLTPALRAAIETERPSVAAEQTNLRLAAAEVAFFGSTDVLRALEWNTSHCMSDTNGSCSERPKNEESAFTLEKLSERDLIKFINQFRDGRPGDELLSVVEKIGERIEQIKEPSAELKKSFQQILQVFFAHSVTCFDQYDVENVNRYKVSIRGMIKDRKFVSKYLSTRVSAAIPSVIFAAKFLRAAGCSEAAVQLIEENLENDTDRFPLSQLLGMIYLDQYTSLNRSASLLRANADSTNGVSTYLALSDVYYLLQKPKLALEAADKAVKGAPDSRVAIDRFERRSSWARQRTRQSKESSDKHYAILGVSYCGSTYLGSVLGGLNGVANVGESHWITKIPGSQDPINFEKDDPSKLTKCSHCRSVNCEVFDLSFRRELAADPVDWYQKLRSKIGSEILVSSDKNYSIVTKLDPLQRFRGIVLFKDPHSAWSSMEKRAQRFQRGPGKRHDYGTVHGYMRVWSRSYMTFLRGMQTEKAPIFIPWSSFIADPGEVMRRLCADMGMSLESDYRVAASAQQHCFGGNAAVNDALRSGPLSVSNSKDSTSVIDDDVRKYISGHEDAMDVHKKMMEAFDGWMMKEV